MIRIIGTADNVAVAQAEDLLREKGHTVVVGEISEDEALSAIRSYSCPHGCHPNTVCSDCGAPQKCEACRA